MITVKNINGVSGVIKSVVMYEYFETLPPSRKGSKDIR
jgi:hypothetical protein